MSIRLPKGPRRLSLLILVSLALNGCASITTKPFPGYEGRLDFTMTDKQPTVLKDLPLGIYRIPETNLYVANQQGDHDLVGATVLFGFTGMAVAAADVEGKNKKEVQGMEEELKLDIPGLTHELLKKRISRKKPDEAFGLLDFPMQGPMQITAYAVLSFIGDKKARLWTILKADFFQPNLTDREWYCRYVSGTEKPRPIDGPEGWASNNGKNLKSSLAKDLSNSIEIMLRDLSGGLRVGKPSKTRLRGRWVFYKKPQENTVVILEQDARGVIVLPQVEEDEYFAGVNILPEDFEEKRPEKRKGATAEVTFQQNSTPQISDRNEKQ